MVSIVPRERQLHLFKCTVWCGAFSEWIIRFVEAFNSNILNRKLSLNWLSSFVFLHPAIVTKCNTHAYTHAWRHSRIADDDEVHSTFKYKANNVHDCGDWLRVRYAIIYPDNIPYTYIYIRMCVFGMLRYICPWLCWCHVRTWCVVNFNCLMNEIKLFKRICWFDSTQLFSLMESNRKLGAERIKK